ncbi:MAG: SgcJ/EcaC family oxidoreductase [Moraxellaceae bacterium]|nr:SgcJ/EcaC family oxidoreductase [Moraxellaceae bacterium]MDZ4386337.1 SgcJ/EcaC family oxidoreductase [Moraxellaceae bacterium]
MIAKAKQRTQVEEPASVTSNDETLIRDLYQQLMDGWNAGSGDAFAKPFADHGDLVAFDGTHFEGRQQISSFHQPLFEKWLRGTRLVGQIKSVRFLSPDVAVMHAVGSTIMRGESKPSPIRDSIQTLVARRKDGEWRLAAFQNTRLRPMSRSFASVMVWRFTDLLWKALLRRR